MKNKWMAVLFAGALSACKPQETVPYARLVAGLTNLQEIARLDVPATQMICSYDRTGANEDYNHFQGKTRDGQCILADLKGPGVMSRLWFTGIGSDKKIRFYFDGERRPRFEFSWSDLRRGVPPFHIAPLSEDEQNCWYTFVPVPFRKRLLITTEDAGYAYGRGPKMYYQLNWHPLPAGQTVESLRPSGDFSALNEAAAVWCTSAFGALPEAASRVQVAPGARAELWQAEGAGTVLAWTLRSGSDDPEALRNLRLLMFWDGADEPSVNVPLGAFFGSVWQRWRGASAWFGSNGDLFFCRFPMPFRSGARLVLENRGGAPFEAEFGIQTGGPSEGGRFHADWRSSGAQQTGTPHTVLQTAGRGRYAGCILAVNSADRSFWALESDESMAVDGAAYWQGTGLEDYFNAGWYYQNVFARPLHGLPDKAPFRTVQYRLHPGETVLFSRSFQMDFERGPQQASHAAYESVAFYYLDRAQPSGSPSATPPAPADPLRKHTLMTDLWNYERFGDLQGEAAYIERYIRTFQPSFKEMLELRRMACLQESGALPRGRFLQELGGFTNAAAQALQTLYSDTNAVLIQLYANMSSRLFLDGRPVLRGGDPQKPVYAVLPLTKGRHVLAVASVWQEYPKWTQVAVRNAGGWVTGTSADWKHAVNPSGDWAAADYDDSAWQPLTDFDGRVKGPPEEPYIWVSPDPFVNTLSRASGLRPSAPWSGKKGEVVYRNVFDVE